MRRQILFLTIFLLLVSSVFAADKVDDRWVWYGDTYERDDVVYFVEEAGNYCQALLYVDDVPYILYFDRYDSEKLSEVEEFDCKDNDARNERYCIEEMACEFHTNCYRNMCEGTLEERYEKKIKYEHGELLLGYRIVTYDYVPELEVKREIKPAIAEFGEQSTITVTIENLGEKPIETIKYRENISDEFTILPIDTIVERRVIQYDVSILGAGGSRTFQYAIIPREYITKTITPTVTYAYEHIKKSVTVSGMSINVPAPMTVTKSLSSSSAGINEEVTYTVTIKNEEDTTLMVDVFIDLPSGINVGSLDEMKLSGDSKLLFDDEIRANREESFGFTFSFPLTGEYIFSLDVEGYVSGKKIDRTYKEKVTVGTAKLEPRITFSKTGNKIRSGQSATLRTYLKNTDETTNYADITATLVSDVLKKTEKIIAESVPAGVDQIVGEFIITAPDVEKTTNKLFMFEGNYSTREGEQFTFSKTLTISVQPDTRRFAVTHTLNTTKAHPGDTVKMAVKVKNTADKYLFVDIYDSFSEVIPLSAGASRAELSLEKGEERQVYLYEFIISDDYLGDLVITTNVYEEEEGVEKESVVLTVTERPVEEENKEVETKEDVDTTGSDGEIVEKKSFFRKAWEWISGLFTFS
ncbi:hypothetical protein GOV10_02775 [Candidatus Woesearchaeota archaeon]|nr:hypothetical protein [Candidatus Woesearchaeota archaeon]